MRADDEYLRRYREELEMLSSANDSDSVSIWGDSFDMMAFKNELEAAQRQLQLAAEGRGQEIQLTSRQRQALEDFGDNDIYPLQDESSEHQRPTHELMRQTER
jgi:hypothetical protein